MESFMELDSHTHHSAESVGRLFDGPGYFKTGQEMNYCPRC